LRASVLAVAAVAAVVWLGAARAARAEPPEVARAIDLAAIVDAPDKKRRREAARSLAKQEGVTVDRLMAAARAFRPRKKEGEADAAGTQTHRVRLEVEGKTESTAITTYVPQRIDPDRPAPLLFYLHGAGGRGEEALGLWREHADRMGMIIVAPTEAGENAGYGFLPRERAGAMAALRWARRRFNIDENRIHLTGVSRGGHMTWDLGARHPDRWATLAPMIGGPRWLPNRGQNNLRFIENVAHLPIRDLQGEQDHPVMLVSLRYAFERLVALKAPDAKFITFADLGHSFRMESVEWEKFLGDKRRSPLAPRVVRLSADTKEGRAYWAEILAVKSSVKDKFTPRVDGNRWGGLDAMGQRRYMDALVKERTARLEARWIGKGRFVVKSSGVRRFRLLLSEGMFDPAEPVEVTWNGRKRRTRVKPSARVLAEDFAERFDRTFLPVAEIRVP
jgi:dienelactone hydrolase